MKLYYSPGACALASQIILREANLKFDLVKTDLKTKQTANGDFKKVNPKGYIPVLELDTGEVLTEGAAILQWIADQVPEKNLVPRWGTKERYKALEWLNFIATELHKGISIFFSPEVKDEVRESLLKKLHLRLEVLDQHLRSNTFILGNGFTVADAYAFNILRWTQLLKIDISSYASILRLMETVSTRDSVRAAIAAEGLKG